MTKLTHLADNGEARMVDVSEKAITDRTANSSGVHTDGAGYSEINYRRFSKKR